MGDLRKVAGGVGLIASWAFTLVVLAVSDTSASTRLRSGAQQAQLASHLSNTPTASSGLVLTSNDIMAAIVGLLAFLSLAFMIVTFIRRHPAGDQ